MSEGGRSHLLNFDDNFLAAAVNDVQTTITVQTEAIHPVVPFYFVIDPFNFENYEVLYCTEIVGTTWTVVRNLAGTKGTTHSLINGDANRIRFAYAQQQLDDLWVALGTVADNLNLAPYTHRTAVDAVTAAGEYKRNNADVTLATELYVNELDNGGGSLTNLLESLRDGDVLLFSSIDNDGVEAYNITGVAVLNAITYTIPVSGNQVDGTGFLDLESTAMRIVFGRNVKLGGLADVEVAGVEDQQVLGFKASSGEWVPITNTANKGITSLDYLYDANQTASPVAGDVAPNNATPSLTTNLAISNTDANGDDLSFVLANLKAGDLLVIQQKADGANREDYTIVSNTDQGTFRDLVVTFDSAAGTINDNDPVFVHTLAQLPDLDAVYLRLDTTNDPLTGDLAMGSTKLTGLLDGFDPQDSVSKLQTETDAQARAEAEAIKRMQWLNVWAPGTYEEFDTVFDQQFTMVANKQTSDRAAPQPVGNSSFLLPDDGSNWDGTDPSFVGLVSSANRYTFAVFAVVSAFRVFIPAGSDDTIEYRVYTQDRTDPADILTDVGPTFTTTVTDDWLTVNVAGVLAGVGTILEVGLISLNSNAGTDDTFQWNSLGDSNLEDNPGVGNSESNNADDILRINDTDANAGDQTALLATIIPGSTITVASVSNPAAFTLYQVQSATDFVGYRSFGVQIVTSGLGGHLRGQLSNIRIQVPIPQATEYVESTAGWSTTPTGFADVQGVLDEGGTGGVVSANAYGTDIEVQAYTSSPDWDFLALSGGSGGGGGGGGPAPNGLPVGGVAGDFLRKVDATDFNSEWNDGSGIWLPLSGGTLTGGLTMGGGTFIDMGANPINNVGSLIGHTAVDINIQPGSPNALNLKDSNAVNRIRIEPTNGIITVGGDFDMSNNDITDVELLSLRPAVFSDGKTMVLFELEREFRIFQLGTGSTTALGFGPTTASKTIQFAGFDDLPVVTISFAAGGGDGELNLNSNLIRAVADPTAAQDAATKNYVDVTHGDLYLPLAGGQMSGAIDLNGQQIHGGTSRMENGSALFPTQSFINFPDTGMYVDGGGGLRWSFQGVSRFSLGTSLAMAVTLDMNSNPLIDLLDPTSNQDAATKAYVDTRDALYLPLAGGTMTGNLNLGGFNTSGAAIISGQAGSDLVLQAASTRLLTLRDGSGVARIVIDDAADVQIRNAADVIISAWDQSSGRWDHFTEVDMGSNKIVSLLDGTAAQDAVTKAQLDAATGGFDGSHDGLSDAVGSGLPWADKHHVKYTDSDAVDANTGLWLSLGGGTLTGDLDMVSQSVLFSGNGAGIGFSGNNQGLSLEMGAKNGFGVTPFIDFSTGGVGVDYAVRLISVGDENTGINGGGLALFGSQGLKMQNGPIDMSGQLISDLAAPVSAADAATKDYVDGFLPLSGGTLTGTLEVNERLTVKNVDGVVSGYIEAFPGADRELIRIGAGADATSNTFLQIIGAGDTAAESFAFRLAGGKQVVTINPDDVLITEPLTMEPGSRVLAPSASGVMLRLNGDGDGASRHYEFRRSASFGDLELWGIESGGTETAAWSLSSSAQMEILRTIGQNDKNVRSITHDNAAPSGGIDGDVWLVIP